MKLKMKVTIGSLLLIIILLGCIGFTYVTIKSDMNKINRETADKKIASLQSYFQYMLDLHEDSLFALSPWTDLHGAVQQNDIQWLKDNLFVSQREDSSTEYIAVLDNQNKLIAKTDNMEEWEGVDFNSYDLVKEIQGGESSASGLELMSDGIYIVGMIKIVTNEDESFANPAGLLLIARKLKPSMLETAKSIIDMDVAVKTDAGEIITTVENPDIQSLDTHRTSSVGLKARSYRSGNVQITKIENLLTNKDGKAIAIVYLQFENKAVVSVLNKLLMNSIVLVSVVLLITAFIYFWFSQILVKSITKLKRHAQQLEKYDLSQDVPGELLKYKDEIGDLSKAFSDFVIKIRAMIQEVKSSVNETSAAAYQIATAAEHTGKQAEQIAIASGEVAIGTARQSENIDSIMNLINDNRSKVDQGVGDANNTLENAKSTSIIAQKGKDSILRSIEQLSGIRKTVEFATDSIQNLARRSNEINNIVTIITQISDQTNLLALNASIESARAGEAGKGFAVVAQEIRKLAEESNRSAESIRDLIKDIQAETDVTTKTMESNLERVNLQVEEFRVGGEALGNVVDMVYHSEANTSKMFSTFKSIQEMYQSIEAAILEITSIIQETEAHAKMVAETTEHQSAATEEMVASADSLAFYSDKLKNEVDIFKTV